MRKLLYLVIIILIVLSGCKEEEKVGQTTEEVKDLTTLKVIADSEDALAAFKMEEENIKNKFGVKLEYYFPNRLNDNLEDFLFASEETFDIYILFPGKIPQYVEREMLLPLDSYIEADPSYDEIIPIYRKMYMEYNDHEYGVVYDGDTHFLFYRRDLFEKYNDEYKKKYGRPLLPPTTWEEYDQIAKFLTRDEDSDGKIEIYGTATFTGDAKRYVWFAERFLSMGGNYFDKDMNPQINNSLGKKALQDWINLQQSGATPPNAMYDWIDLNNVFLQGEVAMVVQWSDTSRFSFDEGKWDSKVAGKVDWTVVPGDDPNSPRGGVWIGRVLGISSQTKNQEAAWQVVQHLTSKEVSSKLVTSLQTINDPFRKSHFELKGKGAFPNEEIQENTLKVLDESLKHTTSDLMIPGGWEYMQILDKNIGLALINKVTPEVALNNTAKEWDELTETYGREEQKVLYQEWLRKLEEVSSQ